MPPENSVGLLAFPNVAELESSSAPRDPTVCVNRDALVPVQGLGDLNSESRAQLAAALELQPRFGRPIHDALDEAVQHLTETQSRPVGTVLVTDGSPSYLQQCVGNGEDVVDSDPVLAALEAAHQNAQLPSFVVGLPGTAGFDTQRWLSLAAEAGGTATENCSHNGGPFCHIDLSAAVDLASALSAAIESIQFAATDCVYRIPEQLRTRIVDPNWGSVGLTRGDQTWILFMSDLPDCTEGWRYYGEHEGIEFCPASCERLRREPDLVAQIAFGCANGPFE
jgi:hypothetical protein